MARAALVLACALSLLLVDVRALALTQPIAGAVALPAGVTLLLPFPAGYDVYVLSGYSPSGGSSLHADTNAPSKANDYYALDLTYADEPDAGKGLPIVAPLAGTVVKAGWATSGWANYGLRVILAHDLGDGHVYHSLYAHLDSIDVSEGDTVAQGEALGTLGQSCQGALSCGSFSTPHLHWVLHRDSTIGGSGTGGSYGGNAVVPEPLDGAEDLVQGMVIGSTNTGMVVCGDGICSQGETHASCPGDCPVCEPIAPLGGTRDETSLCFSKTGSPAYWYEASEGFEGTVLWTHATDAASADNVGTWSLVFEASGSYRLEAYAEPGFASSELARYAVEHAGGTDEVVLDQSQGGWLSLGDLGFDAGPEYTVRLDDNTGEPFSSQRVLVFDAVRLTRLDPPVGGAGGAGGAGGEGLGGAASGGAGGAGEGGSDATGGEPAAVGQGSMTGGDPASCACTTVGRGARGGSQGALALALALTLAARRLRRRRSPRA